MRNHSITPGTRVAGALAWSALSLMLYGCGTSEPSTDMPSRTDERIMEARQQALERKRPATIPVKDDEPVTGEVPAGVMADVRAHLARRTGAPAESFDIERAQAQVWPSGALGCPQPGLIYTQAPVRGYWIVLRHAGRSYDYRLSEAGNLVLCEGMAIDQPPAS